VSNVGTIVYIPPPRYGHGEAFLTNLRAWKTKYPLVTFSDHAEWTPDRVIQSPDLIKTKQRPWAVNNFVFLMALSIAEDSGFTDFLYLEEDCRVHGHEWDERIIGEYRRWPQAVVGGSPVCWNSMSAGPVMLAGFQIYAASYVRKCKLPVPIYGLQIPNRPRVERFTLYPNGAIAVYNVAFLRDLFKQGSMAKQALDRGAFDMEVGWELVNKFGLGLFNKCAWLSSAFSGYGDNVLNYKQRCARLIDGTFAAVHQIKTDDTLLPA